MHTFKFTHTIDKDNFRFPLAEKAVNTCEVTVTVGFNHKLTVTHVNTPWQLIQNIDSWCSLEVEVEEAAAAVYHKMYMGEVAL